MAKRVVIKIGTSLITSEDGLNKNNLHSIVAQTAFLKRDKAEPIIVTSGAIGQGMHELGLKERPKDLALQQATAAIGQSSLIEAYRKEFAKYNLYTAQVLLSQEDFEDENKLRNLLRCLRTLQKYSAIPVVNENDVTAVYELSHGRIFSDNDMLSALLAVHIRAKLLILLTDVDGVIGANGKVLEKIESGAKIACFASSKLGRGGIKTKIEAAKYAAKHGVKTVIAKLLDNTIIDIWKGKQVGTLILS